MTNDGVRPLVVQSDGTLLLEVHHDTAQNLREPLAVVFLRRSLVRRLPDDAAFFWLGILFLLRKHQSGVGDNHSGGTNPFQHSDKLLRLPSSR